MKKKFWISIGMVFVCGILLGAVLASFPPISLIHRNSSDFSTSPKLVIIGDVDVIYDIQTNLFDSKDIQTQKIVYKEKTIKVILLSDLIKKSIPRSESYSILLVGQDGMTSRIQGDQLSGSYISFSAEDAWFSINEAHPISANVKNLREIVLVSQGEDTGSIGFVQSVTDTDTIKDITPGQLYLKGLSDFRVFEGTSQKKTDSSNFNVTVYKPRKLLPLSDLLVFKNSCIVVGRDGKETLVKESGWLELSGNQINFVYTNQKDTVYNISGIIADASSKSVTNVYTDSLHILARGDNVMVIELDGLGYYMLNKAISDDSSLFLSTIPWENARSVFPSISPVSLASMLTGETPDIHGVKDRDTKTLLVKDIFDAVTAMNKKSIYVEGNIKLIQTSTEPMLSVDQDSNGTDREVFENAIEQIGKSDFLFVHFHGIDDQAHEFGPISAQTMDRIAQINDYVKKLVESFTGSVIITSDHGLRSQVSTDESASGSHGRISYEESIVPYAIIKGQKK